MGTRAKGLVKWFNDSKGYGFIVGEDEKDVFVHWKGIRTTDAKTRKRLFENQKVDYIVEQTDKGLKATDVVTLSDPAEASAEASAEA